MRTIASQTRRRLSKAGRCALSIMLALFFAVPTSLLSAASSKGGQAFAEEGKAWISVGEKLSYSGYSTNYFTASDHIAWCIEPNYPSPSSGLYDIDLHSGSESLEWAACAIAMTAAARESSLDPDVPGSAPAGSERMSAFRDAILQAEEGSESTCTFYTSMHVMLSYCFKQASGGNPEDAFYGATNRALWEEKCRTLWEYALQAARGEAWDGLFTAEEAQYMRAIAQNTVVGMSHGGSYQNIAWVESVGEEPRGALDLVKVSDSPALTDGNSCYSLAGATYSVYSSREDAENYANAVTTMTTDENGYAKTGELDQGMYYVRETWASQSYGTDPNIYEAWVEANQTRRVNETTVSEPAKNDPTFINVSKKDSAGAESAQGAASLAGAEYTVEYFDGWYGSADEARAAKSALRTWTFATDSNGEIILYYADKYKVSGDDLFALADRVVWPMGTYVIHETKAPTGYLVSGNTYSIRVFTDENGDVTRVGNEGNAYVVEDNTYIGDAETVARGDYEIVKTASNTPEGNSSSDGSGREPVAGIQFQIYNASDAAVVSPETGKSVEPGGLVCTVTTDSDGKASTAAGKAVNGWDVPSGWNGALAFGSYTVHEVIPQSVQDAYFAKHGMNIKATGDWKISITKDKQSDPATEVNNTVAQTPLKIVKLDAESGKQIPLPCTFKLLDADKNPVTYTKDGKTVSTYDAGTDGAVTLPMLLPQGTYYVGEVTAPDGYTISSELVPFEVTSDTYNGWDDPIVVKFSDTPIMGQIEVEKTDSETGSALKGAEFNVVAVSDIATGDGTVHVKAGEVVDHLTTGDDGKATTKKLYIGAYNVIETKAPDGYVLDTTPHAASIASAGQDTAVVKVPLSVSDAPTKIVFKKTASDTGAALSDATFEVYDPAGMTDSGYDVLGIKAALDNAFKTSTGEVANWDNIKNDASKFIIGDTVELTYSFTDAETREKNEFEVVATFAPGYKIDLTYADKQTATVYGRIAQVAPEQKLSEGYYSTTVTTGKDGSAVLYRLLPGTYAVREVSAPAGYHEQLAGKTWTLTVGEDGRAKFADGKDAAAATATLTVANDVNRLGTTAKSGENTKYVNADGSAAIVDSVRYLGTVKGQTYTVTGTLHVKDIAADGTIADGGVVTDAEGKPVTATTTFVADSQSGVAEVTFNFDASALVGNHVVAFEQLFDAKGQLIASHEDISDEGQSVRVQPKIGTELLAKTGEGDDAPYIELSAEEAEKIMNLVTEDADAWRYFAYAEDAANDDAAGTMTVDERAALIADGFINAMSERDSWPQEDKDAYVGVISGLIGMTSEEFMTLATQDRDAFVKRIAEQLNKADPAVKIALAKISRAASLIMPAGDAEPSETWSHAAATYEGQMTLVDTVGYIGLTPGVEHTVKGTLISSENGSPLTDAEGNPVTAETVFTPQAVNGTVPVTFTFNAGDLQGTYTVAFEEVYEKVTETETDEATGEEKQVEKQVLIAEHKDLEDKGQTVTFPTPETPSTPGIPGTTYDKTSDMMRAAAPFIAGALAVAVGATVYGLRQRKLWRAEGGEVPPAGGTK